MIKANNLYYSYKDVEVLKGISLDIKKGEFVSITGPSGAGKTTLLHLLGTLDKAKSGSIKINNIDLNNLSDIELSNRLSKKGYKVARRTVSKYREQLDIPVARLRKEL